MEHKEIITILKELISQETDKVVIEDIKEDTLIADLGFDSVDIVNFIFSVEEKFNIIINIEETPNLKNLSDFTNLISHKLKL